MAIRNPAATESAVIPKHVTTRVVRRGPGFTRRAVYAHGVFVGYTLSTPAGDHQAQTTDRKVIPADTRNGGHRYLSDAVVAVTESAVRCPGWGEECGNPIGGSDLCPDCTMARLDAQSSRIHF